MEITIDVRGAIKELDHLAKQASAEVLNKAVSRSINDTLKVQRTAIGRSVIRDYNIPKNYADTISVFTANKNTLTGYIKAGSKPISLANFKPQFIGGGSLISNRLNKKTKKLNQTVRGTKKQSFGVSITIRKTSTIPYAFMIKGKFPVFARGGYKGSGSFGFLNRSGPGSRINSKGMDTPIAKMISVTTRGAAFNKRTISGIKINTNKHFQDRLKGNLKFYSKGIIQ